MQTDNYERKIGAVLSQVLIALHTIVGFIYVPILLHYISRAEYGIYQLTGHLVGIFIVMDFGLQDVIIRYYTEFKVTNNKNKMENVLALAICSYGVIICITGLFGLIGYKFFNDFFISSFTIEELIIAKKLYTLLIVNILITIASAPFIAVISSYEKFIFLRGIIVLQAVLQPIFVLIMLQFFPSAFSVVLMQTIINFILLAGRIIYAFKVLKIKIKLHYLDKEFMFDAGKLASSIFITVIVEQIFWNANQFMAGVYFGTVAVAVYSISTIIQRDYVMIANSISNIFYPFITKLVVLNSSEDMLTKLLIEVGRVQYIILSFILSGFILYGKEFISYWVGVDFVNAYYITLAIIIPYTFILIQGVVIYIMKARNTYVYYRNLWVMVCILNILVGSILMCKYGLVACAMGTGIISFCFLGIFMNWYYYKKLQLDIFSFWKEILNISIWILICMSIGYSFNLIEVSGSFIFVLKIIIYASLFMAVCWFKILNINEKKSVQNIFKKIL